MDSFDTVNAVKVSETELLAKTVPPAIPPTFGSRFTIKQLKDIKQNHLNKAQEAQALIDKATAEGVRE